MSNALFPPLEFGTPNRGTDRWRTPFWMRALILVSLLACALLEGAHPCFAQRSDEALDRALALYERGDLSAAAQSFLDAADSANDPETQAQARNNACMLLNELGRFADSLPICQAAVALRRERTSEALPRSLNNLAVALQGAGDTAAAIRHLREALRLNREQKDWDGAAANLTNLAINYQLVGRFADADRNFLAAIDLCRAHPEQDWSSSRGSIAEINRATLLERLGRYREALELLDAALVRPELTAGARATAELNRGVIYRNLGDPGAAIEDFDTATDLFRQMGSRGGEASVLLNIGLTQHQNLHAPASAIKSLESALSLAAAEGDPGLEIEVLYNLGKVKLDLARTSEARASFKQALDLSEQTSSGVGLWSSLTGLAEVERTLGHHELALEKLRLALDEIERQSQNLSMQSFSSFLAGRRQVYEAAVALGLEDDSRSPRLAFELTQRYKARALDEALERTSSRPVAEATGDELRLDGATLIEYFEVEGRLVAFLLHESLGESRIAAVDIGSSTQIRAAVRRVAEAVVSGAGLPVADLELLGRQLIETPLRARKLRTMPRSIILAPDRFLWTLPFDVVRVREGANRPSRPLIELSAIRVVPSASGLATLARLERPDYALRFEGWTLDSTTSVEQNLPDLENSRAELESAAKTIGGPFRILIGARASEAELRQSSRPAAIRHFSTHTQVDTQSGLTTVVVLASKPGEEPLADLEGDLDGQLSPAEISELDLPAELTVLAACTTVGEPGESSDDALGTLAGAFLVAGARSVLATLWDVDDQSSSALLEQFYYRLSKGQPADQALREAKLALASDPRWQDPYRWAGWVLIGEASGLPPGRTWLRSTAAFSGVAIMLLLFGLTHRRRKNRKSVPRDGVSSSK